MERPATSFAEARSRAQRRQTLQVVVFLVLTAGITSYVYRALHRPALEFRRGEHAFARRDYPAAIDHYEAARRGGLPAHTVDPNLAVAYRETGRLREALTTYTALVQAGAVDPDTIALLAGISQEVGEPAAGIAAYRKLAAGGRLSLRGLVQLAELHEQAGDFESALECYREVVATLPSSAEAHARLGGVLYRHGRLPEARTELNEALRLNPTHRNASINLARVLADTGQLAASVEAYHRVLLP